MQVRVASLRRRAHSARLAEPICTRLELRNCPGFASLRAAARRATMPQKALFTPIRLHPGLTLSHRVVLAPLTRNRASEPSLCANELHVDYYAQRASEGGLLITEAICISPEAVGYPSVPGLWTDAQVDAWRSVTAAVHANGGRIFAQLWHTGRVAHPDYGQHPLLRDSGLPLPSISASAVPCRHPKSGKVLNTFTYDGKVAHATPRALPLDEIPRLLADYRRAARNALRAGFDGVELHAAHGYLIDQFLQDGVNVRTDDYGGSIENRCRLLFDVVDTLSATVGAGRLAVRLSPTTIDPATGRQNQLYYGTTSTDPDGTYAHAVAGLNRWPLAYLLLTESRWTGKDDHDVHSDTGFAKPLTNAKYRRIYKGTLVAAGGFTPAAAEEAVAEGTYDMIAFGRWFLSNPDLPEKLRTGAPLNVYDRATFYTPTAFGGDGTGYTDYPSADGTVGAPGKYPLLEQGRIGRSLAEAKAAPAAAASPPRSRL